MNIEKLIHEHIARVEVMQLATAVNNQPWLCTVHFAYDDQLNLYWLSAPQRRHSQEIAQNPHAAAAMAVQTSGKVIGVQIEGDAVMLTDKADITAAMKQIADRHNTDETFVKDVINGTNKHHAYRLTPRLIQLFDKQNFGSDPQQQWRP